MQPFQSKISVIMPVRNGEAFLDAAIQSIRQQTFEDFELLIINDGSTDNTANIIERHRRDETRIRVLDSGGKGIVAALNLGVSEARGSLIARMDCDDIALPGRFAAQVGYLTENQEIPGCGTDVQWIDADGNQLKGPGDILTGQIGLEELLKCNRFFHPTMMLRRDAMVTAGLYRPGCSYAEDYDLWLRLTQHGPMANLPAKMLQFRKHGAQTSATKRLAQRAATALARQAALRREAGLGEGCDLNAPLQMAVQQFLQLRVAEVPLLGAHEGKDLLVMARFAQQQAGRRWISALESRIKRETALRKAWLLPVWYQLDRLKS